MSVVGVTTNPTIFQAALSKGDAYDEQVRRARRPAAPTSTRPFRRSPPTTSATPATCCARCTRPPTASTAGCRSRSTRGWPTTPTRRSPQAVELWKIVDRPNLLIKIPATLAGLPAITAVLGRGHQRQRHADLLRRALPRRAWTPTSPAWRRPRPAGHDLSKIHSVASFFVSRVDTEIDERLDAIGTAEALALRGKAGVANARLAYAGLRGGVRRPPAGRRWRTPGPARSARCGRRPA